MNLAKNRSLSEYGTVRNFWEKFSNIKLMK